MIRFNESLVSYYIFGDTTYVIVFINGRRKVYQCRWNHEQTKLIHNTVFEIIGSYVKLCFRTHILYIVVRQKTRSQLNYPPESIVSDFTDDEFDDVLRESILRWNKRSKNESVECSRNVLSREKTRDRWNFWTLKLSSHKTKILYFTGT